MGDVKVLSNLKQRLSFLYLSLRFSLRTFCAIMNGQTLTNTENGGIFQCLISITPAPET